MATTSSIVSTRSGMDALTTQAIVHRTSIAKNYVPIVQAELYLPMLQLRKDGDCEIGDPRACLHHQNSAADLACAVEIEISLLYFKAMVKAGYIAHGQKVVLHCTENDEYEERTVVKKQNESDRIVESVEDMLLKYRTKQGNCRPGVDLINFDPGFQFREIKSTKRGRPDHHGRFTRSTVWSGVAWRKKLFDEKKMHDCQRKLLTEEAVRSLSSAACRRDAPPVEGRVSVPTLVIKAAWCFPGFEQRRKHAYGYRGM